MDEKQENKVSPTFSTIAYKDYTIEHCRLDVGKQYRFVVKVYDPADKQIHHFVALTFDEGLKRGKKTVDAWIDPTSIMDESDLRARIAELEAENAELKSAYTTDGAYTVRLEARIKELEAVIKAWDEWEGSMILDGKAWGDGTLPCFTQELFDAYTTVQWMRYAALKK